jgi:hypothetical protein
VLLTRLSHLHWICLKTTASISSVFNKHSVHVCIDFLFKHATSYICRWKLQDPSTITIYIQDPSTITIYIQDPSTIIRSSEMPTKSWYLIWYVTCRLLLKRACAEDENNTSDCPWDYKNISIIFIHILFYRIVIWFWVKMDFSSRHLTLWQW